VLLSRASQTNASSLQGREARIAAVSCTMFGLPGNPESH
jgi:hypothetical protein